MQFFSLAKSKMVCKKFACTPFIIPFIHLWKKNQENCIYFFNICWSTKFLTSVKYANILKIKLKVAINFSLQQNLKLDDKNYDDQV